MCSSGDFLRPFLLREQSPARLGHNHSQPFFPPFLLPPAVMDIITPDSFLFHLLLDRIHVSRVSYNCSHFLPCPAYYWEREKTFALITGGRIRGSRACDFFFFLPRSGLLPFIPAAIRFMSDIAFTFCARCGRRTALLRTWPFGGQKNIIPSLHPSAFSFRRRRRGHSIPRSVHCRHHATRWKLPRPRKKRSLLPRFCLHCGWKSPLLETRLSLFFRPSGAFCMKSGKVGESGATLTLIR